MDHDLSDNDSILSEVDEAQFEDFDPANLAIDERPAIAVDEDTVKLLGRHKRKRDAEGADVDGTKKKKKEGRREKPKKGGKREKPGAREDSPENEDALDPEEKAKKGVRREKPRARQATPENEDALDPEERKFQRIVWHRLQSEHG
jgi:transcription factor SPN1